ncbi:MAG: ABC transporter ATP-binding protein [Chloroflexota bacterium]|nr:ABC transporter ATP-binding protein [Anaerolineales bacterium]MCA9977076.1 ABC transporter ATP-binding protein [Anaerolineales bacterium]MCB8965760.1 ABC transporter ATP-binding protein [Ardenticatenaceae bacterium]
MLKINQLEVAYGDIQVVWGIDLEVPPQSTVALLGPNGAGKTSSLLAMMSLLPIKAGAVQFKGEDISTKKTHEIVESGLVLVPEWRGTFATMTVLENLEIAAYTSKARPLQKQTLKEVFEIFPRLEERKMQKARTLSGGERQMLAIGRALMLQPELLVLDEPSLGLAPLIVDNIFDVIAAIKNRGVSILIVEQNVQLTLESTDYAYIIETGRIVQQGPSAELLKDDRVVEAYLSL